MKTKILSITVILFTTALMYGCLKPATPAAPVLPVGNFAGTFTRLHYSPATAKTDTLTANITLTMSAANGFQVGGDTSHHAGSRGGYVVDGTNIAFSDQTLPSSSTTVPTKVHLNGVYQYVYTAGVTLQMEALGDTLAYFYNLRAQ